MNNQKKKQMYFYGFIISSVLFIISFAFFTRPFYLKNYDLMEHSAETFVSLIGWGAFGNLAKWLFSQYKRLNTGIKGELKTQRILSGLPGDYLVLPNISVEFEGKKCEIDNLVMSSKGLVIVETKSYKGKLEGAEDDNEWKYTKTSAKGNIYTSMIRNPLKQAKRQTYILSKALKQQGIHCWIDSYVYLIESNCLISSESIFLDERSLIHRIVSSGKEGGLMKEDIGKIRDLF